MGNLQPPKYYAVVDHLPPVTDEFVVCLGRPDTLPELPPERLLVLDALNDATLDALGRLDPRHLANGVVVCTTRSMHARHPREAFQAQKILLFLYMKYVYVPGTSTRIPDPLALRPAETPPEYLHLLQKLRNTPYLLRHPLIDKLQALQVGLPCLLLLPGPSLGNIMPHLKELSRRYLVMAISRSLPLLREWGVAPDVLLQLDTLPLQMHFHHPADRFPESVLLSLSVAPAYGFADHFRQVFFIDSFDLSILPNRARIRESWLSSLLACLGGAEALHAPQVLLAGADLRLCGDNAYYCDPQAWMAKHATPCPDPMTNTGHLAIFADDQGREARTHLQYLATAFEAEHFARDIAAAQGTQFFTLSSFGILDTNRFAPRTMEQALEAPVLDKTSFLEKADQAAASREHISLRALKAQYSRLVDEARRSRDILHCLELSDPDNIRQHPCYRYVAENLHWFRPSGEEGLRRLAGNLADELFTAARYGRNVAALHLLAGKGTPVPVLCTAEEEADVLRALAGWRPEWTWRPMGVRLDHTKRPTPSAGSLDLLELHDWLQFQEVVVLGPAFAKEFQYVISLVRGDKVVSLEELVSPAAH